MQKIGLYWFSHDLRVRDNANLLTAAAEVDSLLCVYCLDPLWLSSNQYSLARMSANRWRFLKESLQNLDKQLKQYGQHLLVCFDSPVKAISQLVNQYQISKLYRSRHSGFYPKKISQALPYNLNSLN